MTAEKLKKEIIDLYEKLERDKDLYKEFLETKISFWKREVLFLLR